MLDEAQSIFVAENEIIHLTASECDVLSCLILRKNRCVNIKELAKEFCVSEGAIRSTIYRLQDKLEKYVEIASRGYRIGYLVRYIGDTNDNKISTTLPK